MMKQHKLSPKTKKTISSSNINNCIIISDNKKQTDELPNENQIAESDSDGDNLPQNQNQTCENNQKDIEKLSSSPERTSVSSVLITKKFKHHSNITKEISPKERYKSSVQTLEICNPIFTKRKIHWKT